MEETKDQAPSMSPVEQEEPELSHTDKLVGVFTEPGNTYSKMSKFEPKTSDWIIPLIVVILFAVLSNIFMMSNPTIKNAIVEKQMAQFEKRFDEMVQKGQMTEQQKDQQMETIRDRMSQSGGIALIGTIVGIPIVFFIMFFLVSGVFYLFIKYALKGDGTYKSAMSAYGLAYYILVIQIIVVVILAFTMNRLFQGANVAELMNIDKSAFGGFLLSKLDIFSIWFYVVIGIGFAKMFKSPSTGKYVGTIIGIWLGFSIIFFFIAKAVPFLKTFA